MARALRDAGLARGLADRRRVALRDVLHGGRAGPPERCIRSPEGQDQLASACGFVKRPSELRAASVMQLGMSGADDTVLPQTAMPVTYGSVRRSEAPADGAPLRPRRILGRLTSA